MKTQAEWLRNDEVGHVLGVPRARHEGDARDPGGARRDVRRSDAWERRIQSGQAGGNMMRGMSTSSAWTRALTMFADWTDRIAKGEVPPAPPRPQGLERNVVITEWDWADPEGLSARRGLDRSPQSAAQRERADLRLARAERRLPAGARSRSHNTDQPRAADRPRSGDAADVAGDAAAVAVLGQRGRLDQQEQRPQPDVRRAGPRVDHVRGAARRRIPTSARRARDHPSAKLYPLNSAGRHLAVYDPKTKKLTHISTCFSTHHLMFAEDANHTLWTSGGGPVVGWLNTKMFDETHDEAKSQGWTALIMDTNGNGKRDAYVEPNQPVDPTKDKRFGGGFYAVAPAPDGSVWGSVLGIPGAVVRLVAGIESAGDRARRGLRAAVQRSEVNPGFSPRGMDVDRNGVVLGGARERPPGQLRSPQVQGAAERPEGDRPALPRGLDALSRAAAAVEGRHRSRQRRGELLHVGRSVRHARPRREHADQHRQRRRRRCSR